MILKNRYQILQTLGSGGFGETFIAKDTQMPSGRLCVVKKLRPIADDDQAYQIIQKRFQREAIALEDLGNQSSQIPNLYAYFEEDSHFYLIQEFIEGKTLTNLCQSEGRLNEAKATQFLTDFLPILEYIHSQGIIHRDIKPDNVILRNSDGKPVLIDFGAVKESMGTQLHSRSSQASSIVIGTPGFMPSEQAIGRPVYGSDLYATALITVYLLTGRLPQDIPTNQATGQLQWQDYASLVSPALTSVLDRALQPHARDRYSSASEMLQALTGSHLEKTRLATQKVDPEKTVQIGTHQPTVPIHSVNASPAKRLGEMQKTLLICGAIFVSVMAGFLITRQPTSQSSSDQSSPETTPGSVTTPVPTATPAAMPSIPSRNVLSGTKAMGWIRLGAVNSAPNSISTGEALVATGQPVTIAPMVVPSVGSQVTTITGVNLRSSAPQSASDPLGAKISVLQPNQPLTILNLRTFVDGNGSQIYTVVWAEVGLAQ